MYAQGREQSRIFRFFKGIIDTTLREGFQFAGADFSLRDKKVIFQWLCRIGVDYIEVGNPRKTEIAEMVSSLVQTKPEDSPLILAHIRNHNQDLQAALTCGVDGVNILACADTKRIAAMKINRKQYLQNLEANIRTARSEKLEVRVGVEDSFNQPYPRVMEIYRLADDWGAHRIGAADTLGNHLSWEVYSRIKDIRKHAKADIEVHFHNDLGHSVGNALSALAAGANWVNASLLGIGERTGITPLSSLMVNLYRINPALTERYRLCFLTPAENEISRICGIQTPINLTTSPISGFAHKAGIHLDALIKFGPHKYEAFSPQLIGNRRSLIINSIISGKTDEQAVRKFKRKHR